MKIEPYCYLCRKLRSYKRIFLLSTSMLPLTIYITILKTELSTYFLSFEDNTRLEIMSRPNMIKTEFNLYRQGFIHLSFSLGNKEKVNELTARLKNDGYKILSGTTYNW